MSVTTDFPLTGVAHIAQLEHEYMNSHRMSVCNNCFAFGWDKDLKRCNGCRLVDYCSRECQKKQWSVHKKFCNLVQGKGKPDAYLLGYNHSQAVQMVIDSYRLRVETDHSYRGEDHGIHYPGKWEDGLVWVQGDAVEDFQRYIDLAEQSGILPPWWSFEERMECLSSAVDENNEEGISKVIDQQQLITKYGGDTTIRNGLCILAELVVGYEGKGGPKDNKFFLQFQEFLDLHPQERARLLEGAVQAVKAAFDANGMEFPEQKEHSSQTQGPDASE